MLFYFEPEAADKLSLPSTIHSKIRVMDAASNTAVTEQTVQPNLAEKLGKSSGSKSELSFKPSQQVLGTVTWLYFIYHSLRAVQ